MKSENKFALTTLIMLSNSIRFAFAGSRFLNNLLIADLSSLSNSSWSSSYLRKCGDTTYDPREFDPGEMSIAGKEWQLLRANNLGNETIVIIPGKCSNCKSECPNKMDVTKYLNQLGGFSSRTKGYYEYDNFIFDCKKCKKEKTVFGKIYRPSDMFRGHEIFSF